MDDEGNPLPYAYVVIDSLQLATITDLTGAYILKDVPEGSHQLTVRMMGFGEVFRNICVQNQPLTDVNFNLAEGTKTLDEITIKGENEVTKLESSALAIDVIETQQIKLQSADLGEVLAQTQGVSIQRSGGLGSGTRFSLNGLSGDQVRFFLNGIPLDFSSYATGIANVPVNLVDRVEIYKGVVPIQFGADALGGAVNLVSPSIEAGLQGGFSYQLGSFGTHRLSLDLRQYNPNSGFFVGAGGFYDYARNDYEVDVEVADKRGRLSEVTVPRFHDRYRAAGLNLTAGIRNQPWAKELSLEAFYGNAYNELQHNALMSGIPYGEVHSLRNSMGLNLGYKNEWGKHWSLDIVTGINQSERQFIDTSHYVYNWYGERILRKRIPGEISGQSGASHQYTWDDHYFSRANFHWHPSRQHHLRLTMAPTYTLRSGDEKFSGTFDPLASRGVLFSWVNGLEYELLAANEKLQNIAFVKNYWQDLSADRDVPNASEAVIVERLAHHWGVGNGLRYHFSEQFNAKLTYENAIRLPRPDEVFGDGQLILKNLELEPEQSHNFNLEAGFQNKPRSANQWQVNANTFLRSISNLILLIPATDRTNLYQNVFEATSQGIELSGQWRQTGEGWSISANTTYQRYYNSSRQGEFERFYGDRIPNMPYFFANASASYTLNDTWKVQDKLSFFWTSRYVHEFFRSWESAGIREFKQEIPRQHLHHVGFTYKIPLAQAYWALTTEVQNLFDTQVFDFFGVQRPGRAFYIKLTTQI